jgi:putative salt-induced outer membrane protein YdiY
MTKQRQLLLCALAALIAAPVLGQEPPLEASIAVGYVGTTGNTDTTTFNADLLGTWRTERWTHNAKFQAMSAQENAVTQAERYYLEEKSDFALDDVQYLFGRGTYTDDRFSGFDYQASVAGGYGRHLIVRDNFNLEAFTGVGYRFNSVIDTETEGESIFTLGENLSWQISDSTALTQSFNSDIGADLTVSRFEIALVSTIIGSIATKIAFQARNTSKVPVGNKKTDTQTSVSLVYTF